MSNKSKLNIKKLRGFSLVEMILVVGALAVVVTVSVGDFTRLFDKQIFEQEKINLEKIRKAIDVYASIEKELPTDMTECTPTDTGTASWASIIADYSDLSVRKICLDEMGQPRVFISKKVSRYYSGGSYKYDVYYVTVLSKGINKLKNTPDWTTITGANNYVTYEAGSDDLLVKYNDQENKLNLYKENLNRIEMLEKGLERYARSKRSIAISLDVPTYDNYIFYPSDGRSSDSGDYFISSISDGEGTAIGSDIAIGTITDKLQAKSLAVTLGLPEYVGVNAITNKTMYYISNPGSNRASPCANENSSPPFYPPAIIMTEGSTAPSGCN